MHYFSPRACLRLFSWMCLCLPFCASAQSAQRYEDKEAGFTLMYPTGWEVKASDTQGFHQIFIKPRKELTPLPVTRCTVTVGKVASTENYTQAELNQFMTDNPMSIDAWQRFFAHSNSEHVDILHAGTKTVFGIPAHYAVALEKSAQHGLTLYVRQYRYLTTTPQQSWNIACFHGSLVETGGTPRFNSESEAVLQQIVHSMRLMPHAAKR